MTTQEKIEFYYKEYVTAMPKILKEGIENPNEIQKAIIETYDKMQKTFEAMFYEELAEKKKAVK